MFFSRQRMLSPQRPGGQVTQLPGPSLNPFWWQSRLYPDSGIGGEWLYISIALYPHLNTKPRQPDNKVLLYTSQLD